MIHLLRLAIGGVIFALIGAMLRALVVIGAFLYKYGVESVLVLIGVLMLMYVLGWMLMDHVKEAIE